jgi:DNA-binding XRE family transcriptional regulator
MSDSQTRPARTEDDPQQARIAFNDDLFLTVLADRGVTTDHQRADYLELTPCSVRRYRKGRVVPLLSTARTIAAKLNLGVDDLWPTETKAAA